MAKNKRKAQAEVIEKIDTRDAGLQFSAPVDDEPLTAEDVELGEEFEPDMQEVENELTGPVEAEFDHQDVHVSADVPADPAATVAASIVAIGKLWLESKKVTAALGKHIPNVAAEPELHGFLQRMQVALGDFCHSVEQNEALMSDHLREAIVQAVA